MFSFKDKTAIVTGGARGIGADCVNSLLKMGIDKCAIFDTNSTLGKQTADNLNAQYKCDRISFVKCDVSNVTDYENAFKKTMKTFKKLDILINNAGMCNEDEWEKMIEINMKGTINGTVLGMQFMGKDKGGQGGTIVNISSVMGLSSSQGFPIYCATQHAILGMTRSWATKYYYEKTGVRMLMLCPGVTETDMVSNVHNSTSNDGITNERKMELNSLPVQKASHVSEAMMQMIIFGRNDSVWVSEGGQEVYEIYIPNRIETRKDVSAVRETFRPLTVGKDTYAGVLIFDRAFARRRWQLNPDSRNLAEQLFTMSNHMTFEATDEFSGKHALVTGGAAGIGLQCCKQLLNQGIEKLAIVDLAVAHDACRRLVTEFGKSRLMFVKCDVSKSNELEVAFKAVVQQFRSLDIVINNAGILDDFNWEKELLINVNGTIRGSLLGLKYMSKMEGGSGGIILNMSSISGLVPSAGCPIYTAASYATVGFTKAFSLPFHYAKTGVRMITMCPGITYTKIISGACKKMLNEDMGREWLKQLTTTSTQKTENVVNGIILALLHGENGSIWVSDGGQHAYRVELPQLSEMQDILKGLL
ncbi:uncharacterized protein LOC143909985 [Arctopsyche grandis]|uniref:uncharacterized protein LOC143909985 n=1 Tax=Arctopsyche grandis TaxID=121162 RepID=UPI00406D85BC